jgi:microsomal dipeptidase-like Zn-dependent dipeptidase
MKSVYVYADALGFLGSPGAPIAPPLDLELYLVHHTAVPPHIESTDAVLEGIAQFRSRVKKFPQLVIPERRGHLGQLGDLGQEIGVILGLQDTPRNVHVRCLHEAGIRVMALAYDGINELGSGYLNLDVGLTDAGRKVLKDCAEVGMIVDLSHAGHQTAREVIDYISARRLPVPVMASHGGCYGVYPHPRNLPDDVLRGIANLNGVVGIAALSFILGPAHETSAPAFRRHIEHAIKVCGREAVVIGSDCPYVLESPREGQERCRRMAEQLDKRGVLGVRYPDYLQTGPKLMELLVAMIDGSILDPEEFLPGLVGQNFLSFLGRSLSQ